MVRRCERGTRPGTPPGVAGGSSDAQAGAGRGPERRPHRRLHRPGGRQPPQALTVPLDLAGLPASARDGRLRAAISGLIAAARQHGRAGQS